MLDIKQLNKTAFDFDATYNPVATLISVAVLYIVDSYAVRLLNMTDSFVYVLSPLSIILVLLAAMFIVFGVGALKNRALQIMYAIACAAMSTQILQKYSLVGDYDLLWWGSFLTLSLVWAMLLNLLWRHRILRQSSQCILITITFILLLAPLMEMISDLFSVAF